MVMLSLGELAGKLQNVRWNGDDRFKASCPAHEDLKASLAVRQMPDRQIMFCFAGCAFEAITAALGLSQSEFFAKPTNGYHKNGNESRPSLVVAQKPRPSEFVGPTVTTRYEIKDVDGTIFAIHGREDGQDAEGRRSK